MPFKPDRQHTEYLEARASRVRRTVGWIAALSILAALLLLAWLSSSKLFAKTLKPQYNQQSKGRIFCEPRRFLGPSANALADFLWIDYFGDLDGDGLEDMALCLPSSAAAQLVESDPAALSGGKTGTTEKSQLRSANRHGAAFLLPVAVQPIRMVPTGELVARTRKSLRKSPIVYESGTGYLPDAILRQLPKETRDAIAALAPNTPLRIRWERGAAETDPLVAYILADFPEGGGSRLLGDALRGLDPFYGGHFTP